MSFLVKLGLFLKKGSHCVICGMLFFLTESGKPGILSPSAGSYSEMCLDGQLKVEVDEMPIGESLMQSQACPED